MAVLKRWQYMQFRRRILALLIVFVALTLFLWPMLDFYTDTPVTYLKAWINVFWALFGLATIQEIIYYDRNFEVGRLSGAITALIIAYVVFGSLYNVYGFLTFIDLPIIGQPLYTAAVIGVGTIVGPYIKLLRRLDQWFYHDIAEGLRPVTDK